MSKFHKNKFYRVRHLIDRMGNHVYRVEAADNWLHALTGIWSEYNKENKTLDEAIDQIKTVDNHKKISDKIVFKWRSK